MKVPLCGREPGCERERRGSRRVRGGQWGCGECTSQLAMRQNAQLKPQAVRVVTRVHIKAQALYLFIYMFFFSLQESPSSTLLPDYFDGTNPLPSQRVHWDLMGRQLLSE